jgi:hypothetical protein
VIRNTEGRLNLQRVEPNIWMPTDFVLKLDLNLDSEIGRVAAR